MKRFRRFMSRAGDVICILLVVLTVVLFVRGFWITDRFDCESQDHMRSIVFERGRLKLARNEYPYVIDEINQFGQTDGYFQWENPSHSNMTRSWSPTGRWMHAAQPIFFGYQYHKWWFRYAADEDSRMVFIPLWFLFLLFAIKPTWTLIAWQRRRVRVAKQLCVKCGYDLRGRPEVNTCPECGQNVSNTLTPT